MNSTVLICLTAALFLACNYSFAFQADSDPLLYSSYANELMLRGDYENGLEKLRKAYLLSPYNQLLKKNLAEGYAVFGTVLMKKQQYDKADENFIKAAELYPEEPTYPLLRGICNYHLKKLEIAGYELDNAFKLKPDSVEVLYYLGLVKYENEDKVQALELWQKALSISPEREEIKQLVAKTSRELAVEEKMRKGNSSRFNIVFDSTVKSDATYAIMAALEEAANTISPELGFFPERRVQVSIYTKEDFSFVTEAPEWSGGVYDGTIRLPFGGISELTEPLKATIFHEYAHVVIFEMTHGNCPTWLNEGIAEFFGRLKYNRPLGELGKRARSGTLLGLPELSSSFTSMPKADVVLAYQQSYATVNHLVRNHGWHTLSELLKRLGKGESFNAAFTAVYRHFQLTPETLYSDWKETVQKAFETHKP